jgi:hypothetical protein
MECRSLSQFPSGELRSKKRPRLVKDAIEWLRIGRPDMKKPRNGGGPELLRFRLGGTNHDGKEPSPLVNITRTPETKLIRG